MNADAGTELRHLSHGTMLYGSICDICAICGSMTGFNPLPCDRKSVLMFVTTANVQAVTLNDAATIEDAAKSEIE